MSQSKINQEQLSAIIVYKGPGSFTGLRIGVSVANTYAYALNIPIVGCSGDDWLIDGIQSIKQNINEKIITPEYGGKINITSPKK
jgi:tRNA threonylcarbamoyladenosine biosynthesis protein TsaB